VSGEDHRGRALGGLGAERPVPRRPGCGLRAALIADVDTDDTDGEAKAAGRLGSGCRDRRRGLLKTVIDDDGEGVAAGARRLEGHRRGEGEGVGAAGQRDDDRRFRVEVGQSRAHRPPDLGDGGMKARSSLVHAPTLAARAVENA